MLDRLVDFIIWRGIRKVDMTLSPMLEYDWKSVTLAAG